MKKRPSHRFFAAAVITFIAFLMPSSAAAQALTQTAQVLPPGGNGCPILVTQGVVAHVRNGALHSFDVTIANASYVAVLAQAGNQGVPFIHMSRFHQGGGFLRYHVDIDPMPIRGPLPVSVTLLSSPPGAPTCLTVISFAVAADGTILVPGAAVTPTTPPPASGTSTSGNTGSNTTTGSGNISEETPSTSTPTSSTSTVMTPDDGGFIARMQGLCTGNGAIQLWFLLLAIYVVIAALTALAKPPLAQKSVWLPLGLILVPLIALLAFWYFAPSCRAAGWIPAVSVIIAVAALLVSFREQNPGVRIIPLPPAKPAGGGTTGNKPSTNTPMMMTKAATEPTKVAPAKK